MKIAYLAPIFDGTGYAYAACNTIMAMEEVGLDVVPVPIKLASQTVKPHDRVIKLLEKANLSGVTHVVQHILPPLMTYKGGVKNIGYSYCETSNFKRSGWQYHLNLMDECWVSCWQNFMAFGDSGVKSKINKVSIPLSPIDYNKDQYRHIYPLNLQNRFAFYYIGDWSSRKNTRKLVEYYFSTFYNRYDVVLVLKTYVEGTTAEVSKDQILKELERIKQSLKLGNKYPKIILITDYLTTDEIHSIHSQCQCFVSTERGSAWNIPAAESLAFGNLCLVGDSGGTKEFIEFPGCHLIKTSLTPVEGMTLTGHPRIYTTDEWWYEPNPLGFVETMDDIVNSYDQKLKYHNVKDFKDRFSLKTCGEEIKGRFNA